MESPKSSYLKDLLEAAFKALGDSVGRATGAGSAMNAARTAKGAVSTGTLITLILRSIVLGLVGVGCGIWSGCTGMSAAVPCSPTMAWLIGLREARLNAVSIAVTLGAASGGLLTFGSRHLVSLPIAFAFAVCSTIGAFVGSMPIFKWVRDIGVAKFFWSLSLVALALWLGWNRDLLSFGIGARFYNHLTSAQLVVTAFAALIAGFYGRLSSSGPVSILPILLVSIHLALTSAIATALCVYVIVSIAPALAYTNNENTRTAPVSWPALGAFIGGLIGSHVGLTTYPNILLAAYSAGVAIFGFGLAMSSFKTNATGNDSSSSDLL